MTPKSGDPLPQRKGAVYLWGMEQGVGPEEGLLVEVGHDDFPDLAFAVTVNALGVPTDFRISPSVGILSDDIAMSRDAKKRTAKRLSRARVDGTPISARLLRKLPIGEGFGLRSDVLAVHGSRAITRFLDAPNRAMAEQARKWAASLEERPGRKGRSDHDYATIAALYVAKLEAEPSRATQAVADDLGIQLEDDQQRAARGATKGPAVLASGARAGRR